MARTITVIDYVKAWQEWKDEEVKRLEAFRREWTSHRYDTAEEVEDACQEITGYCERIMISNDAIYGFAVKLFGINELGKAIREVSTEDE